MLPDGITLRRAALEELIDLRHQVLRAGLPRESAIFDADALPDARHYGAFRGNTGNTTVGCATLHLNSWEGEPAWQLRGMAVAPELCGRGVGRAILSFLEADVLQASPVRLLWCNARAPAAGFYRKQGWEIRSEPFDIPTAGPHYKMTKRLAEAAAARLPRSHGG